MDAILLFTLSHCSSSDTIGLFLNFMFIYVSSNIVNESFGVGKFNGNGVIVTLFDNSFGTTTTTKFIDALPLKLSSAFSVIVELPDLSLL